MQVLIPIVASYLLGSIPFGYLLVRAVSGSDIRQSGSGGTGATNVSRRAGKTAGILTLGLDALKGSAAVVIARVLLADVNHSMWWIGLAGIFAMLGHIFPIWLRFHGGKGVATFIGVFLVLAPIAVLFSGLLFVVIVWTTRYVSLGSMIAAISVPLLGWISGVEMPIVVSALLAALLVVYAHRTNINRLLTHTENRFQ